MSILDGSPELKRLPNEPLEVYLARYRKWETSPERYAKPLPPVPETYLPYKDNDETDQAIACRKLRRVHVAMGFTEEQALQIEHALLSGKANTIVIGPNA